MESSRFYVFLFQGASWVEIFFAEKIFEDLKNFIIFLYLRQRDNFLSVPFMNKIIVYYCAEKFFE